MSRKALEAAVPADRLADDPPCATLPALMARAAVAFSSREFLRFGARSITFAQADQLTSRLANVLVAHGIGRGDRVAIMMGNQPGWPLSWLAILKAGAVTVPVNSSYRATDLQFVLADSGASILLTVPERLELVAGVRDACPALREVWTLDDLDDEIAQASPTAPSHLITRDDPANLQYTSGTTGFPKACILPHDYWMRIGWLAAGYAELRSDDVVLTAQPFSYIDPQWNAAMCLTAGVPLVVLPRFSASGFWPAVRDHGATVFYVLGTMPLLLFRQPPSDEDRGNRVRLVLCSGIVPDLHREFEERWGAPWREAYGMTETGADLMVPIGAEETVGSGAIGRPVPTKEVQIVDEGGRPVQDGEPGEIVVRGRPLMLGYWNQPEATADTLRDGWLHTGDLGYRDRDGWFHLVGRLKDMVRRGGENISCAEVEGVLGQHPSVLQAALVPVSDDLFGEEPKAFVRLRDPTVAGSGMAEELLGFARERLARFKVPRFIEFADEFPLTPSERIAKPELLKGREDQRAGAYDAQTKEWG
jgi:acyl-CoA synthetase (AMP-forming)/AMP-acid ligase II